MSHGVCTRNVCHCFHFTNHCFYCSCSSDTPQRADAFQKEEGNASSTLKLLFFSEDWEADGMLLLCPLGLLPRQMDLGWVVRWWAGRCRPAGAPRGAMPRPRPFPALLYPCIPAPLRGCRARTGSDVCAGQERAEWTCVCSRKLRKSHQCEGKRPGKNGAWCGFRCPGCDPPERTQSITSPKNASVGGHLGTCSSLCKPLQRADLGSLQG